MNKVDLVAQSVREARLLVVAEIGKNLTKESK
jgi:hypothetical protein